MKQLGSSCQAVADDFIKNYLILCRGWVCQPATSKNGKIAALLKTNNRKKTRGRFRRRARRGDARRGDARRGDGSAVSGKDAGTVLLARALLVIKPPLSVFYAIIFIYFPFQLISVDIFPNQLIFLFASDDMIMIAPLPYSKIYLL